MLECINLGYLIIKEGDTFNIFPELMHSSIIAFKHLIIRHTHPLI